MVHSFVWARAESRAWRDATLPSKTLRKGIIMTVVRTVKNLISYRQTVAQLGRMSARQLDDVGIIPVEISDVARGVFAR
jgi:uncharacterized protein YjiS (DUF1127 family)